MIGWLRWWLALWLMRLANKIDNTIIIYAKMELGHISTDCWEWSHDRELDHTSNEFIVADKILKKTSMQATDVRMSLERIFYGKSWMKASYKNRWDDLHQYTGRLSK